MYQTGTQKTKVSKSYLKVQGKKVCLKVQDIQKVPRGPRYSKGNYRSEVPKTYVKVQGIQKVLKDPGYSKGT